VEDAADWPGLVGPIAENILGGVFGEGLLGYDPWSDMCPTFGSSRELRFFRAAGPTFQEAADALLVQVPQGAGDAHLFMAMPSDGTLDEIQQLWERVERQISKEASLWGQVVLEEGAREYRVSTIAAVPGACP
jgi:hypothetical protein